MNKIQWVWIIGFGIRLGRDDGVQIKNEFTSKFLKRSIGWDLTIAVHKRCNAKLMKLSSFFFNIASPVKNLF